MKRPSLAELASRYDIIVIGGGITGAGVLHEAARSGAKCLLLEQNDFASGTSAGSSKLVHGGLRYLKSGQWRMTKDSVRERERLLNEAPDLVEKQPFMIPVYRGEKPGKFGLRLGLWIYDYMAGGSNSLWVDAAEARRLEADIRSEGLVGAMLYDDARTNDARLVLTLITQACASGATARNYTRVEGLLRGGDRVRGVAVRDADGAAREVEAGLVVDATGVSAGRLGKDGAAPALRPLRGSHFVFAHKRLPVLRAVSWLHPRDRRPVFAYPWENVTLLGTTDIDHEPADAPWRMNVAESDYLIEGLSHQFPKLELKAADALCCFSAVRPVVAGGKAAASDESRESALWSEPGLVGVTGGKLTTFRLTAKAVLEAAGKQLPDFSPADKTVTMFSKVSTIMRTQTRNVEEVSLAGSKYSLAKVRWAARHEQVMHLDDVMLRRTRLGLVTPAGGRALLSGVANVLRQELQWSDERWREEERRYLAIWETQHAPPAVR
ncbi:MAG: glycerol-3-phosphate dehydrogenase/oxidase [Gammaproteobacteria bacterium]